MPPPTSIRDLISPYNFVPAPETRVWPDWAGHISQDRPFQDGISGTIDIQIKAETALFIGGGPVKGTSDKPIETFYRDGRGQHAIPGTSLRGMIRSVVEIASFGRLGPVNDLKLGFRDLQHDDYTKAMNGRVNAGWLVRKGEAWRIEACHYASLHYSWLMQFDKQFKPGDKQSARDKYLAYKGPAEGVLAVRPPARARRRVPGLVVSDLMEVAERGQRHKGTIVFTGQPQVWTPGREKRKQRDFFFYGDAGHTYALDAQQREDFEFIHSEGKQQGKNSFEPNPDWAFWKAKPDADKVPVFFLLSKDDAGKSVVRAFGLAGMFRLAADQRISDVVERAQAAGRPCPDMAEAIFGYVSKGEDEDGPRAGALRGRVSIGMARAVRNVRVATEPVEAVFGVPKPSFYPHYLMHAHRGSRPTFDGQPRHKGEWRTYMSSDARARGWKRYVIQKRADRRPTLPQKVQERHKSRFLPLEKQAVFTARIRVHNLRQVELGAVLWALDFGERANARHTLGRGRPLGYGRVQVTIQGHQLTSVVSNETVALDDARACFRGYMEHETQGAWEASRTMRELIALATPLNDADANRVGYPTLNPERRVNEFNDIKKAGLALRPRTTCGTSDLNIAPVEGRADDWSPVEGSAWQPKERAPEVTPQTDVSPAKPAGQGERPKEPPKKPNTTIGKPAVAAAELITDGWIEAGFANILQARERRKQVTKDRKKKKTKARMIGVRLSDDRVLDADAASVTGVDQIFERMKVDPTSFPFHIRLQAGTIVEVALTPPAA